MSKDKNSRSRFDKFTPIFTDNESDKRPRLFISELFDLALKNATGSANFTTGLFPDNWVFDPSKYTKGMKNIFYKRPAPYMSRMSNLFRHGQGKLVTDLELDGLRATAPTAALQAAAGADLAANQVADIPESNRLDLIPSISDESIHPEFLTYLLITCWKLNCTNGSITVCETTVEHKEKYLRLSKIFKNELTNIVPGDLSLCLFIKKLLNRLQITYSVNLDGSNEQTFDNSGDLTNMKSIKIPSFMNLLSCITCNTPSPGAVAANQSMPICAGVAAAGVVPVSKFEYLKSKAIDTFDPTLLAVRPIAGPAINRDPFPDLPVALYTINVNNILLINILRYIFSIDGLNMGKIITNNNKHSIYDPNFSTNLLTSAATYDAELNRLTSDTAQIKNMSNLKDGFDILQQLNSNYKDNLITILIKKLVHKLKTEKNSIKGHFDAANHNKVNISFLFELFDENNIITQNPITTKNTVFNGGFTVPVGAPVARGGVVAGDDRRHTHNDDGTGGNINIPTSILIHMWKIVLENIDEIVFGEYNEYFGWNSNELFKHSLLDSYPTSKLTEISMTTDSWWDRDEEQNPTFENKYFRDESGQLSIIENGKIVQVMHGSKYWTDIIEKNKNNQCATLGLNKNDEPDDQKCVNYLLSCINSDNTKSIDKCNKFLSDSRFFENATNEVNQLFPEIALKTLNRFEFRREYYYPYKNNKERLERFRDTKDWYEVLAKKIDSNFTQDDLDKIKQNKHLEYYLNLLVKKINTNPSILNKTYKPQQHQALNQNYFTDLKRKTEISQSDRLDIQQFFTRYFKGPLGRSRRQIGGDAYSSSFNNDDYEQMDNFISHKVRNFKYSHPLFTIDLQTQLDILSRRNKKIAPDTLQKINTLIETLKVSEIKITSILYLIKKYNQIKDLDKGINNIGDVELTLANMQEKLDKYINKSHNKINDLNSIFKTLSDIVNEKSNNNNENNEVTTNIDWNSM